MIRQHALETGKMGSIEAPQVSEMKSGQPPIGLVQMLRLLALRSRLRGRDKWTPEQLRRHQEEALKKLRAYTYANSPFYRSFHQGLYDSPLKDLPVLTKSELMKNWDEIITDRTVKLKDVQNFMAQEKQAGKFKDRYYINTTGGTTGLKGILIYDPDEWRSILASYGRHLSFTNLSLGLVKPLKEAFVTTTNPWHQTSAVASTSRSRFIQTLRIDTTEPMDSIINKLNAFQPELLITYPSIAKSLAKQQMEGRLRISLRAAITTGEAQTDDVRAAFSEAWGVQPFNGYAATETGAIACDCREHRGLHLYQDLVIPEFVDDYNQPVKPGQYSARVLITVLSSRTLPLIRYVLEDSIRTTSDTCPCRRPFSFIDDVQGRIQEVIHLAGKSGEVVAIQPLFWKRIMEKFPCDGWQVFQGGRSSLRIFILNPAAGFGEANLRHTLSSELAKQGCAKTLIELEYPSSLQRTSMGKIPLIKALEYRG